MAVATPPFPDDLPVAPIPRISLAALMAGDADESTRLFDACCDHGFFLLDLTKNEIGIELLDDVERAFQIGQEFFATEQEIKEEFKLGSGNIGYKPFGKMKLKNGTTDLFEVCAVSRDSIMDPQNTSIPDIFQRERGQLQKTSDRAHNIAMLILRILSDHLEIPFSTIQTMHKKESPSSTALRFLYYPPQKRASPTEKRHQSLIGHTDSGTLTILFAKIGGLQILPANANEKDEVAWQWVKPEPNCAVINIGDPLVQWTGGILRSAFHRVLYAPGAQANEDRYSFGYFLKPADDAPMHRLQVDNMVSKCNNHQPSEDLPYNLWHQSKNKNLMQGQQPRIYRGGKQDHQVKEIAV